ncbi:hypothetical protein Thimo_1505 [Thioflavicoccus mobilis 8321]|uniref:Uncharacterized protein n=1 Tax=Thioflavicoccus mobilis 8321 TaxID=765912 RepID=L0GY34_9GAMM|nr:hypothetical protein [Thioflavicoccus mobilis]AGA90290.1 hypothetical protein Thimo_1505 [Thioflavicoccus mobilis 8321]
MNENKQDPPNQHIEGGAFFGTVTAGKVIGRDQKVIVQGSSAADLARLIAEIRALLPEAGLPAERRQAVEAKLIEVDQTLAGPAPEGGALRARLDAVRGLLEQGAQAGTALETLLGLVGRAVSTVAGWAG